jgi:hypothetical protein
MKIKEFLKQINVKALAVAKIKSQLNKKSLTTIKTTATI